MYINEHVLLSFYIFEAILCTEFNTMELVSRASILVCSDTVACSCDCFKCFHSPITLSDV
jgi:hypothetical protein